MPRCPATAEPWTRGRHRPHEDRRAMARRGHVEAAKEGSPSGRGPRIQERQLLFLLKQEEEQGQEQEIEVNLSKL